VNEHVPVSPRLPASTHFSSGTELAAVEVSWLRLRSQSQRREGLPVEERLSNRPEAEGRGTEDRDMVGTGKTEEHLPTRRKAEGRGMVDRDMVGTGTAEEHLLERRAAEGRGMAEGRDDVERAPGVEMGQSPSGDGAESNRSQLRPRSPKDRPAVCRRLGGR
jgi:hypothetical protein